MYWDHVRLMLHCKNLHIKANILSPQSPEAITGNSFRGHNLIDIKIFRSQNCFSHCHRNGYQITFSCLASDSHYWVCYWTIFSLLGSTHQRAAFHCVCVCVFFNLLITKEPIILNGEFMEKMKRGFFLRTITRKFETNEYYSKVLFRSNFSGCNVLG